MPHYNGLFRHVIDYELELLSPARNSKFGGRYWDWSVYHTATVPDLILHILVAIDPRLSK